jgi:hypothetical protein
MAMMPYGWPGPSRQVTVHADFWHPTGACADGLISPSNLPTLSRAALLTGEFAKVSGLDLALAAHPKEMPPLRLIFGINVSVSADRKRAREHARRQVALVAGNPRLWPALSGSGSMSSRPARSRPPSIKGSASTARRRGARSRSPTR